MISDMSMVMVSPVVYFREVLERHHGGDALPYRWRCPLCCQASSGASQS